jgi:hypothetical protein
VSHVTPARSGFPGAHSRVTGAHSRITGAHSLVTPAQAGAQGTRAARGTRTPWIPASAGMTKSPASAGMTA